MKYITSISMSKYAVYSISIYTLDNLTDECYERGVGSWSTYTIAHDDLVAAVTWVVENVFTSLPGEDKLCDSIQEVKL